MKSLLLRQTLEIAAKDIRLQWRQRARIISVIFFGVLVLVLFSLAIGPDSAALSRLAGGFLAIALLFASLLSLSESFRHEQDDDGLEGLLLVPTAPVAIFLGKALTNTLFLSLLAPVLAPAAVVLFNARLLASDLLAIMLIWMLAAASIAAPGTLYSGLLVRTRGQDVLLPLLLFPLEVPALVATVKAFTLVLQGDPMAQMGSWLSLLTCFAVIYWVLCTALFPQVIDDL